jgi:signal transduction histidine kinase
MSEETVSRIWTPFFSTKGEEGNGLGLDICRQFIESHQGQIAVKSKVGEGTVFTIRLPLANS